MTKQNNGGPAFPMQYADDSYQQGMSLRDYFAAKALQGLLSDSEVKAPSYEFARRAYEVADAMLDVRCE